MVNWKPLEIILEWKQPCWRVPSSWNRLKNSSCCQALQPTLIRRDLFKKCSSAEDMASQDVRKLLGAHHHLMQDTRPEEPDQKLLVSSANKRRDVGINLKQHRRAHLKWEVILLSQLSWYTLNWGTKFYTFNLLTLYNLYPKTSTLCEVIAWRDTIIRGIKTYQVKDLYREKNKIVLGGFLHIHTPNPTKGLQKITKL